MKVFGYGLSVLLIASLAVAGQKGKAGKLSENVELKISGMTCSGCSAKVEKILSQEKKVSAVNVDWKKGIAKVTFKKKSGQDEIKKMSSRLAKAGFRLTEFKDQQGESWTLTRGCCGGTVCQKKDK